MDDDDNFDFDDLSDEEKDEIEREEREKRKALKTSPIYKKAIEIYNIVNALVESLSVEDKNVYQNILLESSMLLAPKIVGAMGSESWLLSMQNASIIRYHAEYLLTSTAGLRMFTKAEKEYVQLLRTEMEEFRELFREWVKTFYQLPDDGYEDDWGLFIK